MRQLPAHLIEATNRLMAGDESAVRALTGKERAAILAWLGVWLVDELGPDEDKYDRLLAGVLVLVERHASPKRTLERT